MCVEKHSINYNPSYLIQKTLRQISCGLALKFFLNLDRLRQLISSDVHPLLVLQWYSGNALPRIAMDAIRLELYKVVSLHFCELCIIF